MRKPTHKQYRGAAKEYFHDDGVHKIFDNAKVDKLCGGAYVQVWVWVTDEDAKEEATKP